MFFLNHGGFNEKPPNALMLMILCRQHGRHKFQRWEVICVKTLGKIARWAPSLGMSGAIIHKQGFNRSYPVMRPFIGVIRFAKVSSSMPKKHHKVLLGCLWDPLFHAEWLSQRQIRKSHVWMPGYLGASESQFSTTWALTRYNDII